MSTHEPAAPTPRHTGEVVEARVRRVPKISVFLALGAALGLIAAMILTFAFNGSAEADPTTGIRYTATQVFGFVALACVPIGLMLGGLVAVVLDRVLARRARTVMVDHETYTDDEA
jgi:hypothetical protein